MEADLYSAMANDATVGGLVGGTGSSARVYPMILPQGSVLPAVTYQVIDKPRIDTASLSGHNARVRARVQVDCWAGTYAQVKSLADATRNALLTASAFTALNLDDRDLYEDDTHIYRVSADFSVWYLEA